METCDTFPANGTVGAALCARQRACGTPCAAVGNDDAVTYIDALEWSLRPALVALLARCSSKTEAATGRVWGVRSLDFERDSGV